MDNIKVLRVLSCFAVLVCHLSQRMYVCDNLFYKCTQYGQYGVYVFFIISGYLIVNSYEKYGSENTGLFILKRLIRILALYYAVILWFYLSDTFIFHFSVVDETGYGWRRYFLFLNGFIEPATDNYGYWNNLGASWTIPVFAFAYVTIPLYLRIVKEAMKKIDLSRRTGGVHCILTALLIIVFIRRYVLYIDTNNSFRVVYYMCFFFLGIVVYDAQFREKNNALICMLCLGLLFMEMTGTNSTPLTISIIASIIMTASLKYEIPNATIKKLVGLVDKYSFCIYMTQAIPLQQICDYYYWNNGERLNRWLVFIIVVGGTALCSFAFYILIDKNAKRITESLIERISQ